MAGKGGREGRVFVFVVVFFVVVVVVDLKRGRERKLEDGTAKGGDLFFFSKMERGKGGSGGGKTRAGSS